MNCLPKPRRLIILSLIAVLASVLSFVSSPTATRAASGEALIAVNLHQPTSADSTFLYSFAAMDQWGNTTPLATPANLNKAAISASGSTKPMFIIYLPPDRIEVIDLAKGFDRVYPAPPDPASTLITNPQAPFPSTITPVQLVGGSKLLFGGVSRMLPVGENTSWYVLNLLDGSYSSINLETDLPWPLYLPFAQSPADGMIYANWACQCDAPPGGLARFDLKGKGRVLNLHLGNYIQSDGVVTMSPLGRYIYFTAKDPDQAMPAHSGPGVDANVIMRYRISDGTSSVVVRAAPGDLIRGYTLTSNDPYISYSEIMPAKDQNGNYTGTAQSLIKRVNLATFAPAETLISNAGGDILLWCGDTLYFDGYAAGKETIHSFNPTTGKTAQADGQLVGCAP